MPAPTRTLLQNIAFRIAFCYLLLSATAVYAVLNQVPLIGGWLQRLAEPGWQRPAQWLAAHLFHITGIAAQNHTSDSRDGALAWVTLCVLLVASLLISLIWTAFDRAGKSTAQSAAWLRYVMRLVLIVLLLRYSLIKVFPLQMPPPSLAVLNEPLGSTSPLTLLWTLIGMHPGYEIFCGSMEGLCAILLIFRRTALLGALLSVFVLGNVLVDNLAFDVPVKVGAAHLLLYALYLAAPDLRTLYRFFWLHQPAALTSGWVPEADHKATRIAITAAGFIFVLSFLVQYAPGCYRQWSDQRQSASVLTGEWTINPSPGSRPVLTGEGKPLQALYFEPNGNVMARSSDGRLWRAFASVNGAKHDLQLGAGNFDGERFDATYHFAQPDLMHLTLSPTEGSTATNDSLALTRVALPDSYPLLERKFHWVSEWGYWR